MAKVAQSQKEGGPITEEVIPPAVPSEPVQVWGTEWGTPGAAEYQALAPSIESPEKQSKGSLNGGETYILVTDAGVEQQGAALMAEQLQALQCVQTSQPVSIGEVEGDLSTENWEV